MYSIRETNNKKIKQSISSKKMFLFKITNTIRHRHFFRKVSQNPEYLKTHCNDRNIPFHFACRKWYLYNKPQC